MGPAESGFPVFDAAAQATRVNQLHQLSEQLSALQRIRDAEERQIAALTGSRGYGAYRTDAFVTHLPGGGDEVAGILRGATGQGIVYALVRRLRDLFPLEITEPGSSGGPGQEFHSQIARMSMGSEALARIAYQELARDLEVVTALSRSIDTATDPKAVLDLQARLMAQNAKSALTAARVLTLSEFGRARREFNMADRANRLRAMIVPRFVNPALDR